MGSGSEAQRSGPSKTGHVNNNPLHNELVVSLKFILLFFCLFVRNDCLICLFPILFHFPLHHFPDKRLWTRVFSVA